MKLRYLNEAEAVIEPFTNGYPAPDGSRFDLWAPYTITWARGAAGHVNEGGAITIHAAPRDAPAVTLSRPCDLDLHGFDRLRFFVTMPSHAWLTLTGRIDGVDHTLIDRAAGNNGNDELDAPLPGAHLESLTIQIGLSRNEATAVTLVWLGLVNDEAERRLASRRYNFTADWPGLLEPAPRAASPALGLFFDAPDLDPLRQRMRQPHLAPFYNAVRDRAQRQMRIEPEAQVGDYTPGVNRPHHRRRDRDRVQFAQGSMDVLAFVGLIEQDEAMSRHAARMALAMAHCRWWIPSIAGVVNYPRAYSAGWIVRAMPLVLDWAGHVLTPHGKEVLRDSMVRKALPIIENEFMRWEYIRYMNQGPMHSIGRILMYLSLVKTYPRYETFVQLAEQDLLEMLDHYIQPDGGTKEGMGYWHIIEDCLVVLYALARHRGERFEDYVPGKIQRTGDFALAMRSTVNDLKYLPINKGGATPAHQWVKPRIAAAFSRLSSNARWPAVYAKCVSAADAAQVDVYHLLLAPDTITSQPEPARPALEVFPDVGQVTACRADESLGTVRLHVCSGPSKGGHSHADKGSFILEAAGESLAIDRGSTSYADPVHHAMVNAGWHNLTCPEDETGTPLTQDLSNEGGRIVGAEQHDDALFVASDNRDAWEPGLFTANLRRFVSPEPGLLIIDDELVMHSPHAVSFRLNALHPVQQHESTWWVRGERASLCIEPLNWRPEQQAAEEAGVDYLYNKVQLLRLGAPRAAAHRLLTAVHVLPAGARPRWRPARQADGRVELERDRRVLALDWGPESLTATHSSDDDTEAWAARWQQAQWVCQPGAPAASIGE